MIILNDKRDCIGCANCVQLCPAQCIEFIPDEEGFFYPYVNEGSCIGCNRCNDVCPTERVRPVADGRDTTVAIGAYSNDLSMRMKSSSGGVFVETARYILSKKGCVYGAALDESGTVRHCAVRSEEELQKLQGSKYVQSDLTGVFPQIKEEIRNGLLVSFSGTPCQIMALYSFLGERPDNLLTIEVVCHGVPSPMVYKRFLEEEDGSHIDFRRKERGWQNYDIVIHKTDGRTKRQRAFLNPFMRGFLQNWIVRPSCSKCPAKSFTGGADMTLGDFWGVSDVAPALFDNKGTSIVFLHSEKGKAVWSAIKNNMKYAEVPLEKAVKANPCITDSVSLPGGRGLFFKEIEHGSVRSTLLKYAGERPSAFFKRQIMKFRNSGIAIALSLRKKVAYIRSKQKPTAL